MRSAAAVLVFAVTGLSTPGLAPVDLVVARYGTLTRALDRRLPQLEYQQPDGGLSLWATLPGVRADELVRTAKDKGLAVADRRGPVLPDRTRLASLRLRLTFSAPEHDLERTVEILTNLLR